MDFDLATWKAATADKLKSIGDWLQQPRLKDAPYLAYGTLCGLSLWPLVEAARAGQLLPVVMALGSVAGGVGGNLIAEQVQRWKDRADKVDEGEIAEWVAERAPANAELREALDAILEKLEAIPHAETALGEADRTWFLDTLRQEMGRLGNLLRFEAVLVGSGAIAQDHSVAAGSRGVAAGRDLTIHIVKNYLSGSAQLDDDAFREALTRYLTWLDESCGSLTLRGIKHRDQQVLTLPLDEVYTSLTVQARGTGPTVDVGQLLRQGSRLIVTGAPGSGKSTVLQYVTWTLAHALLTGDPHLAEERLGFTIPQDEEGNPQPSQLKLPLPIFIPLHAYAEHLRRFGEADDARKATLTAFVSDYLIRRQAGLGLPDDFFEQLLVRGQSCLLLLDGLDEVPDEKTRVRVSRAVEDLVNAAPRNQVVVTSRPAAYGGEAVLGARFRHLHLQPMTVEQVARLVTRLYQAAILDEGERARETAALLRAIDNLEKLRARLGADERFITTPLLVRMTVIVHFSRRQLPEQRAELFREVVDVLLAASYHPDVAVAQALAEAGGAMSQRRDLLGVLAFHMHSQGQGTRTIQEADLERVLLDYLAPQAGPEQASQTVDAFVVAARQRGSFLNERSGQYQFLHQSFQEYLVATHLVNAGEERLIETVLEHALAPDEWWEQVLLLAGAHPELSSGAAGRLVERLLAAGGLNHAYLAARCAQDMGDKLPGPQRKRLQDRLVATLRDDARAATEGVLAGARAATKRVRAGRALALAGDPRPDVMTVEGMQFCYVWPGPFWMGEGKNEHLNEHLDYGYCIGRYPVTNAQFQTFVKGRGYQEPAYWPEAEEAGIWREGRVAEWSDELRDRPYDYGDPFDLPNHPVVGVTWYEALAFSRWLAERLRAGRLLAGGWTVCLPSEAEWEKAARGGLQVPDEPIVAVAGARREAALHPNPDPKRAYPWGDWPDENRANYNETRVGTTSAVGCFPWGESPYGVEDLSGNVWEWTRSISRNYPYNPADGRENLDAGDEVRRVLRGGAFNGYWRSVRCARSNLGDPDYLDVNLGFRCVVAPVPSGL